MWLAFVMAITPVTAVASDGRGAIGPFKTETACLEYLDRYRTSPVDYCAPAFNEYQRLNFGKLD